MALEIASLGGDLSLHCSHDGWLKRSTNQKKSSEIPRFADFDVAEIRESAPDASELSIYRHACDLLGVPPNSAVLKKIRDEGGYQQPSMFYLTQRVWSGVGRLAKLLKVRLRLYRSLFFIYLFFLKT